MYYSRLKLTAQKEFKFNILSYKLVVINNIMKKKTIFKGRFDEHGLTGLVEIYSLNTTLIYEIYLRGEIFQKVIVKANSNKKAHSTFTIKVLPEIFKS